MKNHWHKQIHTIFIQNKLSFFVLVIFAAVIAVYGYGLLWLPPEYDEVLVSNAALNCSSNVFIEQVIWIKGQCFPIMLSSYIGGLMAVPERVGFLLFGSGLLQLRVVRLVLSVCSFYLLFLSAKKVKNTSFAILFLLLLFFDFQLWSNLRFEGTAAFPFFLKSLLLYLAALYYKKQANWLLFAIGVVVSFSIWTKFDVAFLYIALVLPTMFFFRESLCTLSKKSSQIFSLLGGIGVGIFPLFFYLSKNLTRFVYIGKELGGSNIVESFLPKMQGIFFQFSGFDDLWYLFRQEYFPPLWVSVFLVVLWIVFLFAFIFRSKKREISVLWASFLVFNVLFLFYSGLKLPHHRILIYPIPHILLSLFLYSQQIKVKALVLGVFAVLFINGHMHFNYLTTTFAPQAGMSNEIYQLSSYLNHANGKVLIGDWGITNQLLLLSNTRSDIKEIAFLANSEITDEIKKELADCKFLVLRHKNLAIFKQADINLRTAIDGELVYTDQVFEVYKCKKN